MYINRFAIKSVLRGYSSPSKDFKANVLSVSLSSEQLNVDFEKVLGCPTTRSKEE